MKKFILGTITGIALASTVALAATYIAEDASFKVFVNGEEFTSSKAVVIDGNTYLPLRAMGDVLGVPVNWNNELRQVEVGDAPIMQNESSQSSGLTESEIITTANDMYYKENNKIPNLGYIMNIEPYKAYISENGEYISYFYDTSNYLLNSLRAYEGILKNVDFTVSLSDDKLTAMKSDDIFNFDYYITARKQKLENKEITFVMIKILNK